MSNHDHDQFQDDFNVQMEASMTIAVSRVEEGIRRKFALTNTPSEDIINLFRPAFQMAYSLGVRDTLTVLQVGDSDE